FWLGANYGLIAEEGGLLDGLRLVDTIRREMETVLKLDPTTRRRRACARWDGSVTALRFSKAATSTAPSSCWKIVCGGSPRTPSPCCISQTVIRPWAAVRKPVRCSRRFCNSAPTPNTGPSSPTTRQERAKPSPRTFAPGSELERNAFQLQRLCIRASGLGGPWSVPSGAAICPNMLALFVRSPGLRVKRREDRKST